MDRAVNFLLGCLVEELWTLPGAREIREVYGLQFQHLTAEAAREQAALARQQLEALTALSADLRAALGQLAENLARQMLAAPAAPLLPSPRPFHNLPQPDYVRFVGRERELEWLRRRLSPQDRAWVMAITGIGGVGKSALALTIGHEYRQRYAELPPEERFEAIIWVSAKERVLTSAGEEKAAPEGQIFRTLGDIYRAIARVLDREEITRAPREEQDDVVRNALTRQRTLLILDNMEGVTDEGVRAFLRNLPPPTKAVVTSREWIEVADVLQLMGMEVEEARALMAAEAEARGVTLTEAEKEALYRRTAGLPLPIRLSIARLAGGETFEQVIRWLGNATGDLPEYCVGGQVDLARQRDPHTWPLLLACALFDREAGAAREALGFIADLSTADRDDGLTLLQRLSLINRSDEDRFWMLPIVQEYSRAKLFQETNLERELQERWIRWYQEISSPYARAILQIEMPNLILVLEWLLSNARIEEMAELLEKTANLLERAGEWDKLLSLYERIPADGKKFLGGLTLMRVMDAMAFRGQLGEAKAICRLAESIADWDPSKKSIAFLIRSRLARIEASLGTMDLDEAIRVHQEALTGLEEVGALDYQLLVQNSLGLLLLWGNRIQEAERILQRGLDLLPNLQALDPEEWRAILEGNITIAKGKGRNYREALDALYSLLPSILQKVDQAEALTFLAYWEYCLGNQVKAQQLFDRAKELFAELRADPPFIVREEYQELQRIFCAS